MKKKTHNQIIHVSDTHVIIRLHTNETLNVPINELTFLPKVNDIVEVYQNQNHVVVCPLPQNNNLLILITSSAFIILTIIGATFLFFRHPDRNIETVDSQSSQQSSSTTSSSSTSSSTSTTSTSSTEESIIDTTAEELRDMENDGRLKTGQLYRFTTKLIRQEYWEEYWEEYSGHFKALNTYHTIWVKASNALMTGVQVQIKKSMIEEWQEGATVTFTVKIMEDSEKFQFWVATDATLITTPTEEQHTENTIQEIDTQAILHGDYSSIAGTWRNETGYELVFDKNGLVKGGQISKAGISNEGVIGLDVRTGPTGYGIEIYPPGISIPFKRFENNRLISAEDKSDKTKIRIIAGQSAPTSSEKVFYKTD